MPTLRKESSHIQVQMPLKCRTRVWPCVQLTAGMGHLMCGNFPRAPNVSNAVQSKNLRDPFREWPALEIMEVEVTDGSEDLEESDECGMEQ